MFSSSKQNQNTCELIVWRGYEMSVIKVYREDVLSAGGRSGVTSNDN